MTEIFRFASLLELRRGAEEDAEKALAKAIGAHRRAEEEQRRRVEEAVAAADRLKDATARRAETALETVVAGQEWERYRARLARNVSHANEQARLHREGPLKAAEQALAQMRQRHMETRRAREALEKLKTRAEAAARTTAERRAEDAASDLALAMHRKNKE